MSPRFRKGRKPFARRIMYTFIGLISAVAVFYLIVLITAWIEF